MECSNDIETLMEHIAEDRVYIFLAGLDRNLDQVCGQVLVAFPLPSLEEPIHRFVMKSRGYSLWQPKIDWKHRPVSKRTTLRPQPIPPTHSPNSFSHFCTHCNNTKHTDDVCGRSMVSIVIQTPAS